MPKKSPSLALFRKQTASSETSNHNPLMRKLLLPFRAWITTLSKVHSKVKRATVILLASAMIWFGTAGTYTPPVVAASPMERLMPSTNDQVIDKYVQRHMFDDDNANSKDPLEAAYREAYEDYKTTGTYPRALKEVTTEVLGQGAGNKLMNSKEGEESSLGVFGLIKGTMRLLERRGLSEATALAVVAGTLVIVAPTSLLFAGMIVGGISKRNMNSLMKKRYGDTYT